MFLMRADSLRGEVGGRLTLEISSFVGKILPVRLFEGIKAEEKESYLCLRAFSTKKSRCVTWGVQHACLCGTEEPHPESPGRIQRILAQLEEAGLLAK
jgi:hypothetical protein